MRVLCVAVVAACLVVSASAQAWKTACQDGFFKVEKVEFVTRNDVLKAGDKVVLRTSGTVKDKLITDGVAKWQFYESYVTHFIEEGDRDYFVCSNKGCNTADPLSLKLSDPTSKTSAFELTFDVKLPAKETGGNNAFQLVFWGQDQDHAPYDFSCTVDYNITTSAF